MANQTADSMGYTAEPHELARGLFARITAAIANRLNVYATPDERTIAGPDFLDDDDIVRACAAVERRRAASRLKAEDDALRLVVQMASEELKGSL
jgi:hypothetical protein